VSVGVGGLAAGAAAVSAGAGVDVACSAGDGPPAFGVAVSPEEAPLAGSSSCGTAAARRFDSGSSTAMLVRSLASLAAALSGGTIETGWRSGAGDAVGGAATDGEGVVAADVGVTAAGAGTEAAAGAEGGEGTEAARRTGGGGNEGATPGDGTAGAVAREGPGGFDPGRGGRGRVESGARRTPWLPTSTASSPSADFVPRSTMGMARRTGAAGRAAAPSAAPSAFALASSSLEGAPASEPL
jgi:hypothetical protein